MNELLRHVLEDSNCGDPDCEVHNIDVAIEEEVVRQGDVAFWLAGFRAGARAALAAHPNSDYIVGNAMMVLRNNHLNLEKLGQ